MAITNFFEWFVDFFGHSVFTGTAGDNAPMVIADTSDSGTPTYASVDGSATGEIAIDMDNTNEVQNVCLYQNDILQFDIDKILEFEIRLKLNQASLDAASSLAFGLTSDRNDAIDSISEAALFRLIGDNSILVESDDGTLNNDDVSTGKTLTNAYQTFLISFATGTSDVKFFVNGQPVATSTTFNMSNYTGSLQAFVQLQKTADTNTDGVTIDYIRVHGRR
jgi:hypothetical protein